MAANVSSGLIMCKNCETCETCEFGMETDGRQHIQDGPLLHYWEIPCPNRQERANPFAKTKSKNERIEEVADKTATKKNMRELLIFAFMALSFSGNAQRVSYDLAKGKNGETYLVLTQPLFVRYSSRDSALTDIKNRLAVLAQDSIEIAVQAAQLRKIKATIEKQ